MDMYRERASWSRSEQNARPMKNTVFTQHWADTAEAGRRGERRGGEIMRKLRRQNMSIFLSDQQIEGSNVSSTSHSPFLMEGT